jgi:hypothetical protein
MRGFLRWCGRALVAGAILSILVNGLLTPQLLSENGSRLPETTEIYLIRQSCSALVALLLLFGGLGLHLAQRKRSGVFGAVAFLTNFVGGCLLFAVEWADVFVLRTVARVSPAAFPLFDKDTFSSIGFGSAASLFVLGWLLMSMSVWRSEVVPRRGAITTLVGLVAIPLLQASPWKTVGAVAGNVIFGAGLLMLGLALTRLDRESTEDTVA